MLSSRALCQVVKGSCFHSKFSRPFSSQANTKIKPPSSQQIREITNQFGLKMSDQDLESYHLEVIANLKPFDTFVELPDYIPSVKYPHRSATKPSPKDNPYGAWSYMTNIQGAPEGKLKGKTIALKDNILLAGVPMMNGTKTLEGYIPDMDATIVTRMLDAGGTIVGKAHCEDLCLSCGSHTNYYGPVHNPHKKGYMTGGSSSGSACLVAAREVDMAIGGDQGGSIRMPSSLCGTYGLKPTWGLVPYTGIFGIEHSVDHTGPITNSVYENALLLEVIAGPDGLDARQYVPPTVRFDYTRYLHDGIKDLKIGVVKEGFGLVTEGKITDEKVKKASQQLAQLGAHVSEVSIPWHTHSPVIWFAVFYEAFLEQMMIGNSTGTGHKELYATSLIEYFSKWKQNVNHFSPSIKFCMIVGQYLKNEYGGIYHAKGKNLSRKLTEEYNKELQKYDLLVMPTTPQPAQKFPLPNCTLKEYLHASFSMTTNTFAFNITGHPALNVPCGMSDGRPIGMMLIGKHWDESTIYRAAYAYEKNVDWKYQ